MSCRTSLYHEAWAYYCPRHMTHLRWRSKSVDNQAAKHLVFEKMLSRSGGDYYFCFGVNNTARKIFHNVNLRFQAELEHVYWFSPQGLYLKENLNNLKIINFLFYFWSSELFFSNVNKQWQTKVTLKIVKLFFVRTIFWSPVRMSNYWIIYFEEQSYIIFLTCFCLLVICTLYWRSVCFALGHILLTPLQ